LKKVGHDFERRSTVLVVGAGPTTLSTDQRDALAQSLGVEPVVPPLQTRRDLIRGL
jgi:hypothetical protein